MLIGILNLHLFIAVGILLGDKIHYYMKSPFRYIFGCLISYVIFNLYCAYLADTYNSCLYGFSGVDFYKYVAGQEWVIVLIAVFRVYLYLIGCMWGMVLNHNFSEKTWQSTFIAHVFNSVYIPIFIIFLWIIPTQTAVHQDDYAIAKVKAEEFYQAIISVQRLLGRDSDKAAYDSYHMSEKDYHR